MKGPVRISIFSWNNKYIVKLETGGLEQTFKLDELQLDSEDQVELLMSDKFIQEALHFLMHALPLPHPHCHVQL